jgi:hypothetical protein
MTSDYLTLLLRFADNLGLKILFWSSAILTEIYRSLLDMPDRKLDHDRFVRPIKNGYPERSRRSNMAHASILLPKQPTKLTHSLKCQ